MELVGFSDETSERAKIVAEAQSWIGTPYHSNADIKGVGVDCGMILLRVFADCGFVEFRDPRPYPSQWSLHQSTERYLEIVRGYARELAEGEAAGPGDIAVFRLPHGLSYHHGGIVAPEWPWIIHAVPPGPVIAVNVHQHSILSRLVPKFFTIWPRNITL